MFIRVSVTLNLTVNTYGFFHICFQIDGHKEQGNCNIRDFMQ